MSGHLLVATPLLIDPDFWRSVVLVLQHDAEGSLGLVLNRPTKELVETHIPGWGDRAAEPGTVASRDEFRGTGGSLYYLRNQDILTGSERLRIELRDKDSGLVTAVTDLQPSVDYDIDYLQGRIVRPPAAG